MNAQRVFAVAFTWVVLGLVVWGSPVGAALVDAMHRASWAVEDSITERGLYSPYLWVALVAGFAAVGALRSLRS